jgi:omega-6 fatty acid desaturase (delta-12 desaturase)
MKRPLTFALDWLLVAAFFALQTGAIVAWSALATPTDEFWGPLTAPAALWLTAWLLPFLTWNWLMGFAIYQHHNHPSIAWYNDRSEWDFFAAQVEGTVHVELPPFFDWLSGRIMQHTAHHVNPKIPLYRLSDSQDCLERVYPQIVIQMWRLRALCRTMALCKLYDYRQHCWLNFAGEPTTRPNPLIRDLRAQRQAACPV